MKSIVKQGDYSFQSGTRGVKRRRLAGIGFLLVLLAFFVSTNYFAHAKGRGRLQGGVRIASVRVYAPWKIIQWVGERARAGRSLRPFGESLLFLSGGIFAGAFMILAGLRQSKTASGQIEAVHGSAHWATLEQIRAASLIPRKGGENAGVYVGGYVDSKTGEKYYLRHDGKEHVLAIAPSRSGKGVGLVVPTLLSWDHSVVILDVKGENWALTSGSRKQQGQKVLRWDPTDAAGRTVTYNPIEEIRLGTHYEVGDVMTIAGILVDPDGRGQDDHWTRTARSLLTGAITHVAYRARKEGRVGNLAEVLYELTKPGQGYEDTMLEWLHFEHAGEGDVFYDTQGAASDQKCHPIVMKTAQEMINREAAEASSVLSTAISFLELYSDPVIAKNTAASDFKLTDIVDYDVPVSLYLVLNPAILRRIRPLIRIFLTQILYALMPEMEFSGGEQVAPHKHRLLLMLDEFPSIGKVSVIADAIAYFAGWDIKAYLITQDLSQLWDAYGKEESITSNCHIQIAYAPNKLETAKYLSEKTGVTTVIVESVTESSDGRNMMFGRRSVSKQQQQIQRPLMTADEVMRLPGPEKDAALKIRKPGAMLVFAAGFSTILGEQILYFLDPYFVRRAKIPAPERSEKLRQRS